MAKKDGSSMVLNTNKSLVLGFVVFIGLSLMLSGRSLGGQLWLDELRETLIIYKMFYPEGNWSPYLEKLRAVKEGITQANQQLVNTAMEEFLMMLQSQAHGINGIAAHALYWIALGLQPHDPSLADHGNLHRIG
jgi:hypothetical protein